MKKIFFCAMLLTATIFFAGCTNDEPSVEVKVEKVLSPEGTMTLTHDGRISLSDEQKILAQVSGKVVATYFESGQDVKQGQPLFKIGGQQDEAKFLQTKAALGEAMTALAKQLSELRQAENLLRQNKISAQEVDEKRFAVEEKQAELDELKRTVQQMEDDSAAGMVFSPAAGQIGAGHVGLGAEVKAGETVLATVGKNNPVVVRFEVSAQEKNFLSAGGVKVSLKFSDGTTYPREGKIIFSDDTMAHALFDNPDGTLLLGSTAQIVLDGVKVPKILLVPENAIQQRGEENFVFVVASNKTAELKKIFLGGKLGNYFIVTDGLSADDSVVVEDLTKLHEGTALSIRN